ncbi:HEPN domain-containing protein [Alkalimarinus coralli]|uniref:HEPN domain-containing protein n=1 Tax=Alkalimarinus coralli TaxID=2935863 RepID=UPI00202AE2E1|nr:HEPN domain-containing protein [Alkalimarinus coralli]
MTLDNLIGKSLEEIAPDAGAINRLLEAAQRNIADARIDGLSNENKFDMAYKAIMQLANLSLQASGFRTLTSKPGHHQTMIQSLPKTVGIDIDQMIVLDSLRKQRNVADYSGDLVTDSTMDECLAQAESLYDTVSNWLETSHPELS